ncbi:MAG: hypothetical protein U0441_29640 [Polyangiaceae bacterium]
MLSSEALFEKCFLPLYPPEARRDLAKARAADANPAENPSIYAQLEVIATTFAELAPHAFERPDLVLDFSDASVHRLGVLLTKELRDKWLSPNEDGSPPLITQIVIHGAVYVAAVVVRAHGGKWQVRNPLWESQVRLESRAGTADLAVFHWWLKALSDDEIGQPRLVDRYRTHVEVPTFDPSTLPVIAPPDRRLPRLAKVRYDLLYKHLRAHLPELKSVGDDFPSPERVEELAFSSLDFTLLGEGRMLLVHGPTKEGLHLYWLDATGFQKSAFFPADSFPAPLVKVEGEKIRIFLSVQKQEIVHEMLWWGA